MSKMVHTIEIKAQNRKLSLCIGNALGTHGNGLGTYWGRIWNALGTHRNSLGTHWGRIGDALETHWERTRDALGMHWDSSAHKKICEH